MHNIIFIIKYDSYFQFYHACDNEHFSHCIMDFKVVQFCDFYTAILSQWATSVLIADMPYNLRSVFHFGGSILFAVLLIISPTGVSCFLVPAIMSVTLIFCSWVSNNDFNKRICLIEFNLMIWLLQVYQLRYKNIYPQTLSWSNLLPAAVLCLIGTILFASQLMVKQIYSYTHSGWHICMSLAILFLLPKKLNNNFEFKEFHDDIRVISIVNSQHFWHVFLVKCKHNFVHNYLHLNLNVFCLLEN